MRRSRSAVHGYDADHDKKCRTLEWVPSSRDLPERPSGNAHVSTHVHPCSGLRRQELRQGTPGTRVFACPAALRTMPITSMDAGTAAPGPCATRAAPATGGSLVGAP